MQRISFDFMARRIRQKIQALKPVIHLQFRNTPEDIEKHEKHLKWLRSFVPETFWGWSGREDFQINPYDSRPVKRRKLFASTFSGFTHKYRGESRKVRRSMARAFVRNHYKKLAA